MNNPKVSVIILNWNGKNDTLDCLNSLLDVHYDNFEIIIVDNGSSDGSITCFEHWAREEKIPVAVYKDLTSDAKCLSEGQGIPACLCILDIGNNLGFCKGNNLGMMQAQLNGSKYFLILNNDTVVTREFLRSLVSVAEANDEVGLAGGAIFYHDEPNTIWWAGGAFTRKWHRYRYLYIGEDARKTTLGNYSETEWVSGCMMLYRAELFDVLGGFDEGFFIFGDEWDLSIRVGRAGYKLVVVYDSKIYHKVGRTAGIKKPLKDHTSRINKVLSKLLIKPSYITPIAYYYGIRNTMILTKRYSNGKGESCTFEAVFLLTHAIRFIQLIICGQRKLAFAGYCGISDYYKGVTGKWKYHK